MSSKPVPRRDWTDDEARMARALASCTFAVGHPHKRFARQISGDLTGWMEGNGVGITENQAAFLRKMVHRYRRQIPADIVAQATQVTDAT